MQTSVEIPIASTTSAAETLLQTKNYDTVIIAANNLAGAEVVTISLHLDGVEVPVTDSAGAAVELTATAPSVALEGGPIYHLDKDITAGACAVYAYLRRSDG